MAVSASRVAKGFNPWDVSPNTCGPTGQNDAGDPFSGLLGDTPGTCGVGDWAAANTSANHGAASVLGLTGRQLKAIMPKLNTPSAKRGHTQQKLWTADDLARAINSTMAKFGISVHLKRQLAFIAQIALESDELLHWKESPPRHIRHDPEKIKLFFNQQYSHNKRLGNKGGDDGFNYRGRGPIQLTGRDNYQRAGHELRLDLLANPDLVSDDINVGFDTAGWYWKTKHVNKLADKLKLVNEPVCGAEYAAFLAVTIRVNGGMNNAAERWDYYVTAMNVFMP